MDQYEVIAHITYELYESRGKAEGHDIDDWLEAEWIVAESSSENEQ